MFKALTAVALIVSSFHAGAAPEKTTTLTTGFMNAYPFSGNFLFCSAVNVSAAALPLTIELVKPRGEVINTLIVTLAPSDVGGVTSDAAFESANAFCRVTFQGSPSSVRAAICNLQAGVGCTSSLDAR